MLASGLCLLVTLVALSWVVLDNNAVVAFEIFNRELHSTARAMGMYWQWLLQSLLRAMLLISCVVAGLMAAIWMLEQNPWGLGRLGRASLFVGLFTCSIAILALPHLSACFRLRRFLRFKAAELAELVASLSSNEGVRRHLEPAALDRFSGVDGWTAWHPRNERWNEEPFCAGLTPVVYLHQGTETSLIVPVDFEYFLAWKLPDGSVTPGKLMPIRPPCFVKSVSGLRRREGWSVVRANLEIEDGAA